MSIFPKHVVCLIAFCAILAIAAFSAETSFPEKTSAASARDSSAPSATTTETVEETVTLPASDVKTWAHGYKWHEDHAYCDGISFHVAPGWDDIAGSMVVGYEHYWKEGAKVLGCPEAASTVMRGTVWFDLSSIASKAPPLRVSVTRALLHYKMDKGCDNHQLLIAQEDWLKGYPANTLVPGDNFAAIHSSCASEGRSQRDAVCAPEDVAKVLNNWLRGEGNGGYANYGFAFAGTVEEDFLSEKLGHWLDNDACWTRFSDFSLTVTYRYDKKEPVFMVAAPQRPAVQVGPVIAGGRKNVALASNGATALAQDFTIDGAYPGLHFQPSYAIDGSRHTTSDGGNYWRDEHGLPSWLEVDFSGSKTINEIDVITIQVPGYDTGADPSATKTFTGQGATDFEVKYWTGSAWAMVPGGSITGNGLVWRKITFPAITTSKIRVVINNSADRVARIVELEAWGK